MFPFEVAPFLAALARVSAWAYTAPIVASPAVPPKARAVLIACLAFVSAPTRQGMEGEWWALLPLEIGLGLLAGFAARVLLAGLEAAGQIAGLLLGIGFASFFDPASGEESLPTKRLGYYFGALAFLSADGLEASILPLLVAPLPAELGPGIAAVLDSGGLVLVLAVRATAPLLLAAMVANIAAALASKAAPALNPFSVMFALFLLVGLGVLYASAPAFVAEAIRGAELAKEAVLGVLGG
jgi:flagellar biosynthetic protein FliR